MRFQCHQEVLAIPIKITFFNIFIVEDDEWYANLLAYKLSQNPDNRVTVFNNAKKFLDKLHLKPDFITIDYGLPDMKGDELYKRIREKNEDVLVSVISDHCITFLTLKS